MEQLACPVTADQKLPTLKECAVAFVIADTQGSHEPLRPVEEMSLQELKLETDSMMALTTFLITRGLGQDEVRQQLFASYLSQNKADGDNLLESIKENGRTFYGSILIEGFRDMHTKPDLQPLLGLLNHYREGYYSRTPAADGQESYYEDSESLILAGVDTVTDRFPHVLHALDTSAMLSGLGAEEKVRLAKASDHLAQLFAKMSLPDLERFTDLINEHDCLEAIMVQITGSEDDRNAVIDQRLFQKMRQLYPDEKSQHAHRRHQGCPAAVSFDGLPSAVGELWQLTVGALEKAGHWD